jgi:hypothetical protein
LRSKLAQAVIGKFETAMARSETAILVLISLSFHCK